MIRLRMDNKQPQLNCRLSKLMPLTKCGMYQRPPTSCCLCHSLQFAPLDATKACAGHLCKSFGCSTLKSVNCDCSTQLTRQDEIPFNDINTKRQNTVIT